MSDTHWTQLAACRGMDTDLFVPASDDGNRANALHQAAKAVCAGCPSRQPCLDEALARREEWGVFGGTTPQERHALRRKARMEASA